VSLDLAAMPAHTVIQGRTRAGKSSLAQGIIAQAASSPEVVIAGCDPSGMLLHPLRRRSHSEWRAVGARDVGAHVSALTGLVEELDRRIDALLGEGADKAEVFTHDLPLVLVVMEEYPGLIAAATEDDAAAARKPADRHAPRIRRDVARLVMEGAKCGIRALSISQRATAEVLGGTERSNFATRITLAVDNPDAVRMLHPYASPEVIEAAHEFPPGVGLIESPGHRLTRVRFDRLPYSQYRLALGDL
jgi:DNA segregation ATPase FtsK/SpoIIIE-like protein